MRPLAIDLFAGLGGFTEAMMDVGYFCVGFDIERHEYGEHKYPGQLVLQDVRTLHGSQFKDAALIVASPPCQEFSWMAMPWSRAKQVARALRGEDEFPAGYKGSRTKAQLTELFDACFRIQREASEAAGHHIPMVVENVRGAQRWVGRARWNFGSFYLWGDVPALMPMTKAVAKVPGLDWNDRDTKGQAFNTTAEKHLKAAGFRFDGSGRSFQSECVKIGGTGKVDANGNRRIAEAWRSKAGQTAEAMGIKQGGDWFNSEQPSISRQTGSKSPARKAASAMIAKIPYTLARHIADVYLPRKAAA